MNRPTTSGANSPQASSTNFDTPAPGWHRALGRLRRPPLPVLLARLVLLPLAVSSLTWQGRATLAMLWRLVLEHWCAFLRLPARIEAQLAPLPGGWSLQLPVPVIQAAAPAPAQWWLVTAVCLAALLAAGRLPAAWLPLRYLIRACVFVQAIALVWFAWPGVGFPYTLSGHLRDCLASSMIMMLLMPWLHALTYGLFEFGTFRTLALTIITLAYLAVLAPFKCLGLAWLTWHASLLVLPLLFWLGGVMFDMLMVIALFAWAMSWPIPHTSRLAQ